QRLPHSTQARPARSPRSQRQQLRPSTKDGGSSVPAPPLPPRRSSGSPSASNSVARNLVHGSTLAWIGRRVCEMSRTVGKALTTRSAGRRQGRRAHLTPLSEPLPVWRAACTGGSCSVSARLDEAGLVGKNDCLGPVVEVEL